MTVYVVANFVEDLHIIQEIMMEYGVLIIGVVIVVFLIFYFIHVNFSTAPIIEKSYTLSELRNLYNNALAELRQNPTSPTLHENALHLGRLYAAATRENKAVTLFDETALANDIRAATANASQQVAPVQAVTTQTTTLDERINALKKLKESGLISDEEFAQKRKEILDSI
jgi:hypothetical protein